MKNHVSTLIFDLGNVIINLLDDQQWYQNLGAVCKEMELMRLKNAGFFDEFEKGNLTELEFLHSLKTIAINTAVTETDIIAAWNTILLDIPPSRVDMLKKLKQKYRIILLSNTNSIHISKIEDYCVSTFGENCLQTCFHHAYFSYDLHERKPDAEIYEQVKWLEDFLPNETYFFDDKPENLIYPSMMGIQTFLVDQEISHILSAIGIYE
ncbi:MAG TPA: HAD-IA family hydrolase [Chitinophagales bacterium]|nr:HAD-IA family hydrolase [Chitinophagales bacterium]HNL84342.1 HAD-IA family hydrolase [Chitinophagales bacterium]